MLEGYCLRPGTLAYGHTLSKECCLHSGRSRADALIEACASAGAGPAHWRGAARARWSGALAQHDGRARIADRKCRAGRRGNIRREYMDPLEYKKLQCCKNLFTRYGFIDRKTKITEDAA